MADGKNGGGDDLKASFVFVPHGDPPPLEWMARHPGWVKFPATFVPHPVPQRVVSSRMWDEAGVDKTSGYGPMSRPVSVGAPVVQRRRVPVHRLPTGAGGMDTRGAVAAYRQASEAMEKAASTYLASIAGRSGTTKRMPTSPMAATLEAHRPESDGPHLGHMHLGEAAQPLGHSASISKAEVSESLVDAAKASGSPEDAASGPGRSEKLNSLPGLTDFADASASMAASRVKLASPGYQYVADDGMPGNN